MHALAGLLLALGCCDAAMSHREDPYEIEDVRDMYLAPPALSTRHGHAWEGRPEDAEELDPRSFESNAVGGGHRGDRHREHGEGGHHGHREHGEGGHRGHREHREGTPSPHRAGGEGGHREHREHGEGRHHADRRPHHHAHGGERAPNLPPVSIAQVMEQSRNFPLKPAVTTYTTAELLNRGYSRDKLRDNFESFRVIIQERGLALATEIWHVLNSETRYRTLRVRSIKEFLDRLIRLRAVGFSGPDDHATIVVNTPRGLEAYTANNIWTSIGRRSEQTPFILENCPSYEEVRAAGLLTFSSHTVFLNDGRRDNKGFVERNKSRIQGHGLIIGGVGPRLQRERAMDHRDLMILNPPKALSKIDALIAAEYRRNACNLPMIPLYSQRGSALLTPDATRAARGANPVGYFDQCGYRERLAMTFDPVLIDTNDRAKLKRKVAVLEVTGLGLGVWKFFEGQSELYIAFFFERVQALEQSLKHIRTIRMMHIRPGRHAGVRAIGGIRIEFSDAAPALRLARDELLAYLFAANANAYGGNGFWLGDLDGSAEPAAAAFSQIAETFNPHINPRVSADSVYVATRRGELVPLDAYLAAA